MKRALLPVFLSLPLIHVVAACSAEDAPPVVVGNAGAGGSPGGVTGGSAGSAPLAGTSNSTSGSGGTGTAGTTSTAGSGGSGVSGGSSGGSGGSSGGSGGSSAGSGGSSAGSGGSSAGSGGSGGSAAAVSVGKLDGMLVQTPCKDSQTDDCDGDGWIYEGMTNPCVGGNLDTDSVKGKLEFPVTGEPGKRYIAKMHFYGIMEPKNYGPNAMREAGTTRPNVNSNPSTPPPFATMPPGMSYRTSDYNTYEVHTFDNMGVELQQYFINADNNMEGHYTFAISYPHDIEIVGGGKVKVRIFDDNCRMIKNCSDGGSVSDCTTKARSIDISAASPQPMGFQQPGLGNSAEQSGQWFLIDVKEIVPKP